MESEEVRVSRRRGNTSQVSLRTAGVRRGLSAVLALASTLLSGCGPTRVRVDFTHYENSFAVTSNQEVLLNLARLANRDPTYFFKLGQISSSYRMQASLPTTASYNPVGSAGTNELPGGGGSPSLIYENDPSFSFIPVNDETNAQLLLRPVPEEVFYNLYQQGWRVDQLFRLMVDRIEITLPQPDGSNKVEIIRNVPPPAYYAPDYLQSPRGLDRYVTFLRVSAVVYALQKHGLLLLRGSDTFAPLDSKSALADAKGPAAKDIVDAAAKDQVWEKTSDGWVLGQKTLHPRFQLNSIGPESDSDAAKQPGCPALEDAYGDKVAKIKAELNDDYLPSDPSLSSLRDAPELTDTLEILYNGFAIGGSTDVDANQLVGGKKCQPPVTAHLVMRSLIGLMTAAAQEQEAFDKLESDTVPVPSSKDSLIQEIHTALCQATSKAGSAGCPPLVTGPPEKTYDFQDLVPPIERLPVLQLDWESQEGQNQLPPLEDADTLKRHGLAVDYNDKEYMVTDVNPDAIPAFYARENQDWNRDMFRLIGELSSQVTVDISKFPLPEILQLRTE